MPEQVQNTPVEEIKMPASLKMLHVAGLSLATFLSAYSGLADKTPMRYALEEVGTSIVFSYFTLRFLSQDVRVPSTFILGTAVTVAISAKTVQSMLALFPGSTNTEANLQEIRPLALFAAAGVATVTFFLANKKTRQQNAQPEPANLRPHTD